MATSTDEVAMDGVNNTFDPDMSADVANAFAAAQDVNPNQAMNTPYFNQTPGTPEVQRIYQQDPTPLPQRANEGDLWQFPNPDPQSEQLHSTHPIGKLFYKTCDIINRHWDVEPYDIVPLEMRSYTPYSQALLLGLRRLASHTKGDYQAGQQALLTVWRDRTQQPSGVAFDKAGVQCFQTVVKEYLVGSGACETVIQETNYGLTLQDAQIATKVGTKIMKALSRTATQPIGTLRCGNRQARRADKLVRKSERKAREMTSRNADVEKRQKNLAPFAANSKIAKRQEQKQASKMRQKVTGEKGYKLLRFLQGEGEEGFPVDISDEEENDTKPADATAAPPNNPQPSKQQNGDTVDRTMSDGTGTKKERHRKSKATGNYASGLDRHNDQFLSQMFNRVGMDDQRNLKKKKAEKLVGGATARQGSLPSDRVKLAEIPSLFAQQGTRLEEKLGKVELVTEEQGVRGQSVFARGDGDGAAGGGGPGQGEVVVISDDEDL